MGEHCFWAALPGVENLHITARLCSECGRKKAGLWVGGTSYPQHKWKGAGRGIMQEVGTKYRSEDYSPTQPTMTFVS